MDRITLLSQNVIAKIAAGEVIERPAFAVKELIENALDAHATMIRIEIEKSGLQRLSVTDNGEGMTRNDVLLSYKRYTTSKITDVSDLHDIHTLGFRGEALSALAAVSKLQIQSKPKKQLAGTLIEIVEGKLVKESPFGMPQGTTISAEDLFGTLPARQKFLKSPQSEFRTIVDIVTQYALAFPTIHFSLLHNRKVVFDVLPDKESERIKSVLRFKNDLIPVHYSDPLVQIKGWIGTPDMASTVSQKYFLYVNKRSIKDKSIAQTIKNAFGTILPQTKYPFFLMFIEIAPNSVDVNVHPRKEEIAFREEQPVLEKIFSIVQKTLNKKGVHFQNYRWSSQLQKKYPTSLRTGPTNSFAAKELKKILASNFSKTILQIHNTYLILETKSGFLLIDQHAAHERILFEQLRESFLQKRDNGKHFVLQKPLDIPVNIEQQLIINEFKSQFELLGFSLRVRKNSCRVFRVPYLFHDRNIPEILLELIDGFSENGSSKEIDHRSEQMLTYLACRGSIMAGDSIPDEKRREIVDLLFKTKNNTTCPHGRPTFIEVTRNELDKMFDRV